MKKKFLSMLLAVTLMSGIFSGCQKTEEAGQNAEAVGAEESEEKLQEEMLEEQQEEEIQQENEAGDESRQEQSDEVAVRIAALKGPTTMGLVKLWQNQDEGTAKGDYEFQMMTSADEVMSQLVMGDIDIGLIPANVAAMMSQHVKVIDINTLGVLYLVSGQDSVDSVEDLKGKTIYLTGYGTTPDYALQYLLAQHNIELSEVTLEYKSEAMEVAALLKAKPDSIGLLPQPFATVACAQNEELSVVMDLNAEWAALNDGKGMVTGVTVVRREFLEEHPEAVALFMEEHKTSAEYANTNIEETAEMVAQRGIIEKAPIAAKALPACNITYIDGQEMKEVLSEYIAVLFEQNPKFVGGAEPSDDFYMVD